MASVDRESRGDGDERRHCREQNCPHAPAETTPRLQPARRLALEAEKREREEQARKGETVEPVRQNSREAFAAFREVCGRPEFVEDGVVEPAAAAALTGQIIDRAAGPEA